MWRLYQTAQTFSQRPSQLAGIDDAWAAYQLDSAVAYFGMVITNASQEMVNVGDDTKPRYRAKYTLKELLTEGFVLADEGDDMGSLSSADGIIYDEV